MNLSPPLIFALIAGTLLVAGLVFAAIRPQAIVRHAPFVLVLVALVSAASLLALVRLDPPGLRLAIDPSTEPMLPASDPAKDEYRAAVRDFGDDEVFVIAMETSDVFTAENLGALRHVSDRIAKLPEVREVKSLARVTSFRWVPAKDWIEIRPLIEEIPSDPEALAALRARAVRDPLFRRTLVSEDARTAALNVSFRKMTDREFIAADIDGRIQRILDEETRDGRRFHVAGRPHVKSRVYHLMLRDLALLMPLAVAGIAAVLTLCLGSWQAVVLPARLRADRHAVDLRRHRAARAAAHDPDRDPGAQPDRDRQRLRRARDRPLPRRTPARRRTRPRRRCAVSSTSRPPC